MAADMSGEQMQAKITAARREAEGLKDKIKRRKDELADTTRMQPSLLSRGALRGLYAASNASSRVVPLARLHVLTPIQQFARSRRAKRKLCLESQ
ncbi:G protein subunit beta [Aspergillus melleus]|uniref:G protein subunit beta n=1 Tax=Aspergillus melleus TaxID=138277 RepID=A0ACC3B788_9EURO|nr:G protein subunit beta [Aspergillus melleus]